MKITELVQAVLERRLDQKKRDVIRLKWEKVRLEKQLESLKRASVQAVEK